MSKKYYILSVFILSLFIIICIKASAEAVDKNNYIMNKHAYSGIYNKNCINKNEDVIARLVINKLGIDNYIYNINSHNNNVNKNVTLLKQSVLPNETNNSIIFLAAHSGNGRIAFFKNLDKLIINDLVYFYYNNYKYTYKVINISEEEKDGDIEVNKINNNQLILTTCSPNNDSKQLIVSNILIQKEEI